MPWRVLIAFFIGAVMGAIGLYLYLQSSGSMAPPPSPAVVRVEPQAARPLVKKPAGQSAAPAGMPRRRSIAVKPLVVPAFPPGGEMLRDAMAIPVAGVRKTQLKDHFLERRGPRQHNAIDIRAPRGTPVLAAVDGTIRRVFASAPGGLTIYLSDPAEKLVYYYAHLDRYAEDLYEGKPVLRGEVIAYVGTSGNAAQDTPHLHFQIMKLPPGKEWWKGEPINPYPLLLRNGITYEIPAS